MYSYFGFQSTLPARGATGPSGSCRPRVGFQSTLPARGATQQSPPFLQSSQYFNPRSLRGERPLISLFTGLFSSISIHAPCEGSDVFFGTTNTAMFLFQSTLPARGATSIATSLTRHEAFQSTLPARGATSVRSCSCTRFTISIHAPCEGSDFLQSAGRL